MLKEQSEIYLSEKGCGDSGQNGLSNPGHEIDLTPETDRNLILKSTSRS